MKQIQVYNDFLDIKSIDYFVENVVESHDNDILWHWHPITSYHGTGEDDGQFIHLVAGYDPDGCVRVIQPELVEYCKLIENVLIDKISKDIKTVRIKFNAIQRGVRSKYITHQDWQTDNHYSLLLYLNDSDGETVFEIDGKEQVVQCRKNTAVIFDSTIPHYNYRQTDAKLRVVLNMIFEIL